MPSLYRGCPLDRVSPLWIVAALCSIIWAAPPGWCLEGFWSQDLSILFWLCNILFFWVFLVFVVEFPARFVMDSAPEFPRGFVSISFHPNGRTFILQSKTGPLSEFPMPPVPAVSCFCLHCLLALFFVIIASLEAVPFFACCSVVILHVSGSLHASLEAFQRTCVLSSACPPSCMFFVFRIHFATCTHT